MNNDTVLAATVTASTNVSYLQIDDTYRTGVVMTHNDTCTMHALLTLLQESRGALAFAQRHANLFSTVGIHPTRCDELNMFSAATSTPSSTNSSSDSSADYTAQHLQALKAVIDEGTAAGKVRAGRNRAFRTFYSRSWNALWAELY
jgi:Tat protein secretion system quality control protein TatD with DNase activity